MANSSFVGKILKIVLIAVLVVAAVFFIINIANYAQGAGAALITDVQKSQMNSAMLQSIALCVSVLGVAVYLLLHILGMDKIGAFVLICAGIVTVVLLIVALAVAGPYLDSLKPAIDLSALAKAGYYGTIFTGIAEALVFGAAPIIYGIKKVIVK